MKKRTAGAVLAAVLALSLVPKVGIAASNEGTTLEVTPSVTIAAGSGGGFLVNMTSSDDDARVEVTIPAGFEVTNYPDETDETVGDYIESASLVGTSETEQTVTVEFAEKVANLGFTVTVRPTYKVEHNGKYTANVKYYYDGQNYLEENCTITTTNQTISANSGYYRVQAASTVTNFRNDQVAYYAYSPVIYTYNSSLTEHYNYKNITMTVPLTMTGDCATPVPMIKDGDGYTALTEGQTYSFTNAKEQQYTVVYRTNYELKNSNASSAAYTGPVLIYSLDENSTLATGADTTTQFNNGVYLMYAHGQPVGTYYGQMREQINVTGQNDTVTSIWTAAKLSSYASIYVSFYDPSPAGSIYMSGSVSSTMSLNTIVIPQKDTTNYSVKFTNNYGELSALTLEYTFPADSGVTVARIYMPTATFGYKRDVSIVYTTSKDRTLTEEFKADTVGSRLLDAAKLEAGEYITKITVSFSNIQPNSNGEYGSIAKAVGVTVLDAKMWNATNTTGEAVNVAKVTGVNGEALTQSGHTCGYSYQKSDESYITSPTNDLTAIKVGDVITTTVTPGAWNYKGATYNPDIYVVVPKGYVYVDGSFENKTGAEHAYVKDSEYTITSFNRTVNGKEYTVYKLSYTDGKIRTGYSNLKLSFKVTEYVDMSSAQIKFPAALYVDNGADKYKEDTGSFFISSYVGADSTIVSTPANYYGADIYDLDGDGDMAETVSKPASVPTVALNLSYVLVTNAAVEIDNSGEKLSQDGAKYFSTGVYTSTIFNRLQGEVTNVNVVLALDDLSDDFDILMTGPATMSAGCEGTILYSTDGSDFKTAEQVSDWSRVRFVQYDLTSIAVGEINELSFPFEVDFSNLEAVGNAAGAITSSVKGSVSYKTNTSISANAEIPRVTVVAEPTVIAGQAYIDQAAGKINYANATLKLLDKNGKVLATTKSDADGMFSFGVYTAGEYTVAVELTDEDKAEAIYKVAPLYSVTLDDTTTTYVADIPITNVETPTYANTALNGGYAYIFGHSDWLMAPEETLLRGELSAMLYRLMKQHNKLAGFVFAADSPSFEDIAGQWYQSGIEFMRYRGAFAGISGNVFPEQGITRGEAYKLICLGLGFTDNSELALSQYALILIDAGYLEASSDGSIGTAKLITRFEVCLILNRITGRSNKTTDSGADEPVKLETKDGIAADQLDYIARFAEMSEDQWYYAEMVKATSAFTDGYIDVEKRGVRNELDDYIEGSV